MLKQSHQQGSREDDEVSFDSLQHSSDFDPFMDSNSSSLIGSMSPNRHFQQHVHLPRNTPSPQLSAYTDTPSSSSSSQVGFENYLVIPIGEFGRDATDSNANNIEIPDASPPSVPSFFEES